MQNAFLSIILELHLLLQIYIHDLLEQEKLKLLLKLQLKKLKEMESELSRYKQMYAELAHQNYALKDLIEKKL